MRIQGDRRQRAPDLQRLLMIAAMTLELACPPGLTGTDWIPLISAQFRLSSVHPWDSVTGVRNEVLIKAYSSLCPFLTEMVVFLLLLILFWAKKWMTLCGAMLYKNQTLCSELPHQSARKMDLLEFSYVLERKNIAFCLLCLNSVFVYFLHWSSLLRLHTSTCQTTLKAKTPRILANLSSYINRTTKNTNNYITLLHTHF